MTEMEQATFALIREGINALKEFTAAQKEFTEFMRVERAELIGPLKDKLVAEAKHLELLSKIDLTTLNHRERDEKIVQKYGIAIPSDYSPRIDPNTLEVKDGGQTLSDVVRLEREKQKKALGPASTEAKD